MRKKDWKETNNTLGRTIPSFRIALNQEIQSWKSFQKALDRDDKEKFEAMLNSSRLFASASSASLRTSVFESMAMSILFDHYSKLVNDVMRQLDEIGRSSKKEYDEENFLGETEEEKSE